jgi:hypothetical protein
LKENRYANKIRNIPIIGKIVDNIPYINQGLKYADDAGFGKKKRGKGKRKGKK